MNSADVQQRVESHHRVRARRVRENRPVVTAWWTLLAAIGLITALGIVAGITHLWWFPEAREVLEPAILEGNNAEKDGLPPAEAPLRANEPGRADSHG